MFRPMSSMAGVKAAVTFLSLLGLAACQTMAPGTTGAQKEGYFTTSDNVRLHYIEAGKGKPLVLIPGWSQTAAQFKHQLSDLSADYHVIAIDMRGHGESDKPDHGYRIQRLSADVHEFLVAKGLRDVAIGGHSMGCSVIWGYWEQYGSDRLSKILLIDQMPMITANPLWSAQEKESAGAIFTPVSLYEVTNALAGPDGVKTTEGFITGMYTPQYSREEVKWVVSQNLKMPRKYAAALLYDHATNDWRDVLKHINIPTLVVGGKTSLVGWKSQQWVASQIPGAQVVIFEESEGGNHFMFMENPQKFNKLVRDFVK
jgi:non-heme chloroperoxidase